MFVTLEGFLCPIVCFLSCTFDPMQVASKPVPKSTQLAPAAQAASYWNFMRFWRNAWKVRKTGASKHSFFKRSSLHKNVFFWHHKGDPPCSSRLRMARATRKTGPKTRPWGDEMGGSRSFCPKPFHIFHWDCKNNSSRYVCDAWRLLVSYCFFSFLYVWSNAGCLQACSEVNSACTGSPGG